MLLENMAIPENLKKEMIKVRKNYMESLTIDRIIDSFVEIGK